MNVHYPVVNYTSHSKSYAQTYTCQSSRRKLNFQLIDTVRKQVDNPARSRGTPRSMPQVNLKIFNRDKPNKMNRNNLWIEVVNLDAVPHDVQKFIIKSIIRPSTACSKLNHLHRALGHASKDLLHNYIKLYNIHIPRGTKLHQCMACDACKQKCKKFKKKFVTSCATEELQFIYIDVNEWLEPDIKRADWIIYFLEDYSNALCWMFLTSKNEMGYEIR